MLMDSILIWDWNGTLLDDVAANHAILDSMLARRGLGRISLERYRELFRMPIVDMYRDLGFDFADETFEQAAQEYFGAYRAGFGGMPLNANAVAALEAVKARGVRQYIVSAMKEDELLAQVERKGIKGFFDGIVGLDNVHAASKLARAAELAATFPRSQDILLVGDMDHDYEVARAIGARCLLYGRGHQEIRATGDFILIDDLRQTAGHLRRAR